VQNHWAGLARTCASSQLVMRWVTVHTSRAVSPVRAAWKGGEAVRVTIPSASTRLETGRIGRSKRTASMPAVL